MLMRILTLLLLLMPVCFAESKGPAPLDKKAIRLIDPATQRMYLFHEVKGVHLAAIDGQTDIQAYGELKKAVTSLKPEAKPAELKGNPASFFCTEQLKGKSFTYKDLLENEYAVCQLSNGTLADAWDLFRLKKK